MADLDLSQELRAARKSSVSAPPPAKEEGEDVTYIAGEGDPARVKWRGIEFHANVPVRITNESHIAAARGNKFFRVSGETSKPDPFREPTNAMEYRAHVVDWMRGVSNYDDPAEKIDYIIRKWASDRNYRTVCEVGQDDVAFLGTMFEPEMQRLRKAAGLSDMQVADMWVRHGVLDLPWRG